MRPLVAIQIALLLALTGCSEEQIQIYELPKQEATAAAGGGEIGALQQAALVFSIPKEWQQVTPSSGMVRRQFAAQDAKVTQSAFPGNVGGDLANINRWRGQLALPAIEQAAVESAIETREAGGFVVRRVDLSNSGRRMVIDMIRVSEMTWFIKIDGPAETVAEQLTSFDEHVGSLRPEDAIEDTTVKEPTG
ncbi:MAG: hypothetical protein AAF085_10905 [Planctomycetota bacterium]